MDYKDKLIECAETIKNFCAQNYVEEHCPFFGGYRADEYNGVKIVKCVLNQSEPCSPCNWQIGE